MLAVSVCAHSDALAFMLQRCRPSQSFVLHRVEGWWWQVSSILPELPREAPHRPMLELGSLHAELSGFSGGQAADAAVTQRMQVCAS